MADHAAARQNMVESQVRPSDVTDVRIHDAMRSLPREALLPADRAGLAYSDAELEYAPGRFLMKPRDVAKLIQAVRPVPGERVLAIAAPYAAQVLAHMGLSVTRFDEGDLKSPPHGPFDLVICEGAVAAAPAAWLGLLAPGGRLALVERAGPVGKARIFVKGDDGIGRREVFDSTPPLLPGFEAAAGFAF